MSDLKSFIAQGWADHADDAAGVALRLPQALDHVEDAQGLMALARLAHHVYGEHQAQWADGLKFLAALARGPGFDAHGESGLQLQRLRASLALAGGLGDVRDTLAPADRALVSAQAASALSLHDLPRSRVLLADADALDRAAALPGSDPAVRAMAMAAHNIAATLQDQEARSDDERQHMLDAAHASQRWWQRAGTWLEAERAEYRLSHCWRVAGDAAQARAHAQACLDTVMAQAEPPALERFFAHEALALACQAGGDAAGHAASVAAVQQAFGELSPDDQAWCRATLDPLVTGAPGAGPSA